MEHTQGHTRLDEEVGGGCQLEVSKKPEARFLFITRKWLGMRVREERWALVAQDDVSGREGAVFENKMNKDVQWVEEGL